MKTNIINKYRSIKLLSNIGLLFVCLFPGTIQYLAASPQQSGNFTYQNISHDDLPDSLKLENKKNKRTGNSVISLAVKPQYAESNYKAITGSASATYTSGDIDTERDFDNVSESSSCPGELTVTIPIGAIITSVDVEYDMTAIPVGTIEDQRSQLRCVSPGGTSELSITEGLGAISGTYSYSRTGLSIANNVTGGGDIDFELHAGRTNNGTGCRSNKNRVDDNTWTVTVNYSEVPIPDFTIDLPSVFVYQPATFTDNSTGSVTSWDWDFGLDAVPATANTQGPHSVAWTSDGLKTISLTINGAYTETKTFMVEVADPVLSTSATYSSGNLPTDGPDYAFSGDSDCPGTLTVTIPNGAIITGVDVAYDMQTNSNGWMSEQRSQLRCVSAGGISEGTYYEGTGETTGTQSYSRTGLEIANGVTGGGDIEFELHAARTWPTSNFSCNTDYNFVVNYTWTITVYYSFDPVPNFYADKTFVDIGETVIFTDISLGAINSWEWDFGIGSSPGIASTQGPHSVTYSTVGFKDVNLEVNGTYNQLKEDYIFVGDPNNWLKWDDNINFNAVGRSANDDWQIAVRFEPADYSSFVNSQITKIRVYIRDVVTSSTIKIWQGTNYLNLTEYVSQAFTPVADSWNIIDLNTPYIINASEELWFGVEFDQLNGFYPAGVDATTSQNGKSNMYRIDLNDPSDWNTLTSTSIDGDWNLQAYLVQTGSWIGVVSSQWEDPNNWFSSTVPNASTDVNIPITPNDPYIRSDAEVNDITIEAGASLTIGADRSLTVNGTLVNNAGVANLIIQSNIDGTGSLISTTPGVQGTFQRYIKGEPEAWHGLSSPMTDQEISGDFTPPGDYADGTGYDFYTWYEPDTSWIYLLNDSYPPTWLDANGNNDFTPGKGYMVSYQDTNPTLNFEGTIAAGSVNVPITLSTGVGDAFGSNLLGNPYPSSIDWKAATGWSRADLDLSGGGYNVWIWNDTAYNYGVYNSTSTSDIGTLGVTRHIPPTQGFFVLAAQSGTLGFTDDLRVNDGSSNWLKSKGEKPELFFLAVYSEDGNGDDEIMLEMNQNESKTGATKRFSFVPTAPGLWIPKSGQYYSSLMIDSITQYPVLPVSFRAGKSGSFKMESMFYQDNIEMALLHDNKTGETIDLLTTREFTFLASKSDDPGRFVLQFKAGNYPDPHQQLPVRIFTYNRMLYIDMRLIEESCKVEMYNPAGAKVFEDNLNGGIQYEIQFPNLQGAFIVRVTGTGGNAINKVAF